MSADSISIAELSGIATGEIVLVPRPLILSAISALDIGSDNCGYAHIAKQMHAVQVSLAELVAS